MPRRLLLVEQRLWLRGKGLMLSPGVIPLDRERIKAGDQVVLARPDGSRFEAMIQGTSTALGPGQTGRIHLLLDIPDKHQVPIGTEVWAVVG